MNKLCRLCVFVIVPSFLGCTPGKSSSVDPGPQVMDDPEVAAPAARTAPRPTPRPPQNQVDAAASPAIDPPEGKIVIPEKEPQPKPDAAAQPKGDAAPTVPAPRPDAGVATPSPDAFFGPSRCQAANAQFCEDFEGNGFDPAKWAVTQMKATPVLDSTHVARGQKAMQVKIVDPTFEGYHLGSITTQKSFPVAGQRLFVRAFIFLTATSTHRHYGVFLAAGNTRYHVDVTPEWNPPYLPAKFRLLWDKGPGGEPDATYGKPSTVTPLGRWACWEWDLRGATNEVHFSIDDIEIPGLKVDPKEDPKVAGWTAPTNARLRFGIESFHAMDPAFSIWIDEIAVSDQKIGCVR